MLIKFTINLDPRTKKNSPVIVPGKSKYILLPSPEFRQYEKDARWFMPHIEPIDYPVNVQAIFYKKTRRKVDLPNLMNGLLDVLVKYQVLEDDNRNIVYSTDGSRVLYDKERPRTEVIITPIEEEFESWEKKK